MGDMRKVPSFEELSKMPMIEIVPRVIEPKISISDIKARRFNIIDRTPIGTPLVRVESGMGSFLRHYQVRFEPDDPHYFFPKRALVLSFHEPGEPAEVELFWDEDSATEAYDAFRKRLWGIEGPWELTLYRIGEEGYPVPQIDNVVVVVNSKDEAVDVMWLPSMIVSRDRGTYEQYVPWESMVEPPKVETANPCAEISMGEPVMSKLSYDGVSRKLLAVEELPPGAMIYYEHYKK